MARPMALIRRQERGQHAAAKRRTEVSRLYLLGQTHRQIGQALGIDHTTVSRDLKVLRETWLRKSVRNFDAARAQELARIDNLERIAWEEYERSKLPVNVTINDTVTEEAPKSVSLGEKKGPHGSPMRDAEEIIAEGFGERDDAVSRAAQRMVRVRTKEYRKTTEAPTGNPSFLNTIQWCIERRCALLGLDVVRGENNKDKRTLRDVFNELLDASAEEPLEGEYAVSDPHALPPASSTG